MQESLASSSADTSPLGSGLLSQVGDTQRSADTLRKLGRIAVEPGPLIRVLQASPDDRDAVVAAIEASPALSARLLCVTNSAGVGLARHIDNVKRAVIHLGPGRARLIAMGFGVRMISEATGLDPQVTHALWVSSLRKAAAAKLMAEAVDPRHADRAYTMALLQDIGLPLLMAVDPNYYAHEMTPGVVGSWCDLERTRFGLDHAAVGRRLLEGWNASSRTCDAVLDHHRAPTLQGDEGLLQLPLFMASLMPHMTESPTATELEWLVTLHAQFLAEAYASPDAFFAQAAKLAAPVHGHGAPPPKLEMAHMQQLVKALAVDVEGMVLQLSQLEDAVGRQREHLSHLRFQAFTDPLTKVLNRRGFIRLAQRRIEQAVCAKAGVAALVIDLDDFKPINDQHGHEGGDLVLRGLSKLLRRNLDRSDLIGRIGGDEFVVLLTGLDEEKAKEVALRVAAVCKGTRVRVNASDAVPLRMSIGGVHVAAPDADVGVEDLIAAADAAMYEQKRGGKGGLCFKPYAPDATGRAA